MTLNDDICVTIRINIFAIHSIALLITYTNLNMICGFAMSVVGQDLKLDMFSYIILSVSIFFYVCF